MKSEILAFVLLGLGFVLMATLDSPICLVPLVGALLTMLASSGASLSEHPARTCHWH